MQLNDTIPSLDEIEALVNEQDLSEPSKKKVVDDILSGLTPKQKKLALLTITHPFLSEHERLVRAGYSPKTSATPKQIQGRIGELLLNVGISEIDIASGLRQGLNAEKVTYGKEPIIEKDKEGVEKVVGYRTVKRVEPDYATRKAYIELILRSHRSYMPGGRVTVKHELPREMTQSLKQLREREKALSIEVEADFEVVGDKR